jgi:hypothetical protein
MPAPAKYYEVDQIKEVSMGRTRGMHRTEEKSYTIFVGKPERKRMLGSYRLLWRTTSNRKLMKLDGSLSTAFRWLQERVAGWCYHGHEHSDSTT